MASATPDRRDNSGVYLGIDIGGTKMAAVIGNDRGEVLLRRQEATPGDGGSGWQPAVELLTRMACAVCAEFGIAESDAVAVGVSCGGPLDAAREIVVDPPNLPAWRNVPLKRVLTERLRNPRVILENDANATALAEFRWGAGQGTLHMAYLTFGTGMGAGLILNGKLYRGKRGLAGEIGHATVFPDGPLCLCGKSGCLEAVASGGALDRIARERYVDPSMSAERLCDLARQGDPVAIEIVDSAAKGLGIGIANLLQTLDLEKVVLGSLAVRAGDLFLEPIRRYAREYTWPAVYEAVSIVPAGLGHEAQDRAALAVAMLDE